MSSPPSSSSPNPLLFLPPWSSTPEPRLQSLYADISRQQHSNPAAYQANVEWWQRALEAAVSSGLQAPATTQAQGEADGSSSRLVLNAGRPLVESLRIRRPGVGAPLALGAVITHLLAPSSGPRALLPLAAFLAAPTSIYTPPSLPTRALRTLVVRPLWWALEQLSVVGEDGLLAAGDAAWHGAYVVLALVERAADAVLERQRGAVAPPGEWAPDGRYTVEGFCRAFGGVLGGEGPISAVDARVLLRYLERERKVLVREDEIVKFILDPNASTVAREITAVDRGILELRGAVQNLQVQVDSLQLKIDETTKKASFALSQNRRPVALSHLRTRRLLEDLLKKRVGALGTLEGTLISVEGAAGDVEIMGTYTSSTTTLRTLLAHPLLQRARVDATMDALAEATADAREVDEAVRSGGELALGINEIGEEDELEEELQALVKEVQAEGKRDEILNGLTVPTDKPIEVREEKIMLPDL